MALKSQATQNDGGQVAAVDGQASGSRESARAQMPRSGARGCPATSEIGDWRLLSSDLSAWLDAL